MDTLALNPSPPPLYTIDDEEEEAFAYRDLSPKAQSRAREETIYSDGWLSYDWWDSICEDAVTIADMMGIEIFRTHRRNREGKLVDGGPQIYFSGFCSQGDGACFAGRWRSQHAEPWAMFARVVDHAPQDEELHRIAFGLAQIAQHDRDFYMGISALVSPDGRYYHSHSPTIEVEIDEDGEIEMEWDEVRVIMRDAILAQAKADHDTICADLPQLLRDFMDWIYAQLEEEHDYLTGDEYVHERLMDEEDKDYDAEGRRL